MGNELGQMREWNEKREQDWDILKYPVHDAFFRFMRDLNQLYLKNPAFWQKDYEQDGFQWLDCHQESRCIYAFERKGQKQRIVFVFNFSGTEQNSYTVKVPGAHRLELLMDTDRDIYGGNRMGLENSTEKNIALVSEAADLSLAPFSGQCYLAE